MNWGKGLAIAMVLFIIFIISVAVVLFDNPDSLYEKDYYAKGENHTEAMKAESEGEDVKVMVGEQRLQIELPDSGTIERILVKNMADSEKDFQLKGDNQIMRSYNATLDSLTTGQWYFEIYGTLHGKPYLKLSKIIIP